MTRFHALRTGRMTAASSSAIETIEMDDSDDLPSLAAAVAALVAAVAHQVLINATNRIAVPTRNSTARS